MTDQERDNADGPKDAVDAGRAAVGDNTATGQAKKQRSGEQEEAKEEDTREIPESVSAIKPDYLASEANEPVGLQAEEASFLPNGSVEHGMVASNSGFVPAASIAKDAEHFDKLVEKQKADLKEGLRSVRSGRTALTDEQIDKMSGAELRAVAHDRGYDISDTMGTRGSRAAFSKAQGDDDSLDNADKSPDTDDK